MNVSALIVLGGSPGEQTQIADIPIAAFDVLGKSPLLRVVDRLQEAGVYSSTVVCQRSSTLTALPRDLRVVTAEQELWDTAFQTYSSLARTAELVLVIVIGPYMEIDYADLIRFHVEQAKTITAVVHPECDVPGVFALKASRPTEAAYLFRHGFKTVRRPHSLYPFTGYLNPLRRVADLRRLAIDAFCGNAELTPKASEWKPGIWVAPSASVHNEARIVAPAFIGAHAKVRAAAVITRCSTLEHHSQVCAGAVVENATLLPNTVVGPSLDVTHAVVGHRRLFHLGRDVEVQINDHRLIGHVPTAPLRLLEQLASIATFVPTQFFRGLASPSRNGRESHVPAVSQSAIPALAPASEQEFPAHLAGVRRYGND